MIKLCCCAHDYNTLLLALITTCDITTMDTDGTDNILP